MHWTRSAARTAVELDPRLVADRRQHGRFGGKQGSAQDLDVLARVRGATTAIWRGRPDPDVRQRCCGTCRSRALVDA